MEGGLINYMPEEIRKQLNYENEILDLIDHRDEFTRGDLQAAVEALVKRIMQDE